MATPSQLKAMTPEGADALRRLNAYKAGQPGPYSPISPPPATTSTTASVLGRGLVSTGARLTGGIGAALYPTEAGDGTLNSPEAQRAIAENEKINRANPRLANESTAGAVNEIVARPKEVGVLDVAKTGIEPFVTGVKNIFSSSDSVTQPNSSPSVASKPAERQVGNLPITVQAEPIGGTPLEQRTYTTAGGTVTGAAPVGRRGGFGGAATDAEADRNLQARFAQDEAAKGVAANYDRAIERLRDVRAAKLGISRDYLDQYEGRAATPEATPTPADPFAQPGDKFGDEVFRRNRLESIIQDPRAKKSERKAATEMYNAYLENSNQPQPKAAGIDPVDMQRFLLDRQKFDYQQGVDKQRFGLDRAAQESKAAETTLERQKYADERRNNFLETFSYPDADAPREQLGALTLQLSDVTGGVIPPEIMVGYIQKAAEVAGVNWKNAPPTSLVDLGEAAMKLARADYGGGS
jgi:hypothetical protein